MLFGRARGAAYAIPACPAAEQQDCVAGFGPLPAHLRGGYGTYHGTDLHALGYVTVIVDLAHMRRRQTYLVAVGRVALHRLARDDALGQFAFQRLADGSGYVARTGDAHRLIDVCPTRQRVAYGTAKTGARASERLNLRGMVVRLVLELQQPTVRLAVLVHIHIDRAGVVLVAHLQVVQFALLAQIARADGGYVH